jgi:hypothetical protein
MKRKVTVLSIDGGGIRGIIPAVIPNYSEEKVGDSAPKPPRGMRAGAEGLLPESKSARDAVGFYAGYGKSIPSVKGLAYQQIISTDHINNKTVIVW